MSKNSSKALNWIAGGIAAYFVGSAIAGAIKRKNATSGIGAAKRRIYKEISLAQQAGVDFAKKYDELTDDEILALQRVSNDTGFTETYYKGLKKAYDAISGIGEAYDVADENGNTVLTWIEDPEIHAAHNREIEEARQRTLEAEARAEKARKSKRATERRLQQMSLFGIGYPKATPPFWYGIKSVELIPHGEWSDPEIYYKGRLYNAVVAEEELYAIWREQIEFEETPYDFETWMRKVGGDYLKSDVLPYMNYEVVV